MNKPTIKNQASKTRNPRIAIVADWLTDKGGAERFIYELHRIYPEAHMYTSTIENKETSLFKNLDVRTAWMQRLPKVLRKYQLHTIPRQRYFSRLNLRGYDVVISAGSSEAKAVRVPDGFHIHICYTPTLYYWIKPENYLKKEGTGGVNPLWRIGLRLLTPLAKKWDYAAAQRPDKLYAISKTVQARIKMFYHRESQILSPPVDIERFSNTYHGVRAGFIVFGRHVAHKRFDLAISACNEIGADLLVIGDGPEHDRLVSMAGPTITFKKKVSDTDMVTYVSKAEAFIFPNEEDFGIVAVEAQAAGTPVIAYRAGGALDTVVEGVTGEFFDEQSVSCLSDKLRNFNPRLYNQKTIIENAAKFSNENFRKNIQEIVNSTTKSLQTKKPR